MSALTSLLPGLREARAPLISGYLWLLVVWLGFGSVLPNRHTDPTFAHLCEAIEAVGPVGIALSLSVVAYFVGSAIQSATQFLAVHYLGQWWHDGRYTTRRPRLREHLDGGILPDRLHPDPGPVATGECIPLDELPSRIIQDLTSYYRKNRDKRWADAFDDVVTREFGEAWHQLNVAVQRAVEKSEGRARVRYEARPHHDTVVTIPRDDASDGMRFTIPQAFLGGLSLIQSRLLELARGSGLKAEQFNAEAELREAVAFALVGFVIVLCIQIGVAWIAGLVMPVALLTQARSLRQHASWELIDALRARAGTDDLKRITPLFARCRDQTNELTRAIEEADWAGQPRQRTPT